MEMLDGIAGCNYRTNNTHNPIMRNCYNIGIYTGNLKIGSISGHNGGDSTYYGGTIENCFYKKGQTAVGKTYWDIKTETFAFEDNAIGIADMLSKLGDAFVADEKDKDGNWIYNNGYPILKWQKEHNVVNK